MRFMQLINAGNMEHIKLIFLRFVVTSYPLPGSDRCTKSQVH